MRVPVSLLKSFVDISVGPEELADLANHVLLAASDHEVLGVNRRATTREIRAAFLGRSLVIHTDKAPIGTSK